MIRNLVIVASLTATCVFAQQPQKVTVCEIQKNPSAYQHRLVQVTATLSQGFERFRIFDPACDESFGIWIEYAGSTSTGVVYCCGQHNGVASVDGIETPLVRDDRFRDLEQRLRRSNQARATVLGHFFAKPGDNGGFGHMGCCHLFVIERVLAVNAEMATLCEIKANPAAYYDKVIQVAATVNREFEDFSLFDPPCYEPYGIGLAFGGTLTIGRKRVTFPRVKDDRYRKLEKLVRGKGTRIRLNVTLVGRLVDRSSIYLPRFLFVIERVLAIDPHKTTVCEINRDTAAFDGKWIEVSAIVNRDLEENQPD